MSVVAVRIYPDRYEIAADSIRTRGWTQQKIDPKGFAKLFEVNGLILGGVGLSEETGLLYLYMKGHRPCPNEDSLLEFFSEFAKWKHEKTDKRDIENEYLIGFDSCVFVVQRYYAKKVINFDAIGAGMDFALSALYLGHSPVKAVETAIELSVFCEGPIIQFERRAVL